jgi:type IV pilus assembly protein PilE
MNKLARNSSLDSGFTLIEILIVIAIVAILVALALPNYQQGIRKARRADAQTDLLEFAGNAERIFTQTNSYATVALPGNSSFYVYSSPVAITAISYSIRATPTAAQSADACGSMTLTQTGQRTQSGTLAGCW